MVKKQQALFLCLIMCYSTHNANREYTCCKSILKYRRRRVQVGTMTLRKQVRFLVSLLMTAIFLFMLGKSITEWSEKKVGETQKTHSAAKILYPSVTMMPIFLRNFSLAKLTSFNTTKNLTEYNLKTSHIQTDIISIHQKYDITNG